MLDMMRAAVLDAPELSTEERNLLSVAWKSVVGAGRDALRAMRAARAGSQDAALAGLLRLYHRRLAGEVHMVCRDQSALVDKYLLPAAKDADARVFFLKMKGDSWKYTAEASAGAARKSAGEQAQAAYAAAEAVALQELKPTHPVRLGLLLNFSIFLYEILGAKEHAIELAQKTTDDALSQLDELGEDSYRDSALIIQLLRDNIGLWGSPDDEPNDQNDNDPDDIASCEASVSLTFEMMLQVGHMNLCCSFILSNKHS